MTHDTPEKIFWMTSHSRIIFIAVIISSFYTSADSFLIRPFHHPLILPFFKNQNDLFLKPKTAFQSIDNLVVPSKPFTATQTTKSRFASIPTYSTKPSSSNEKNHHQRIYTIDGINCVEINIPLKSTIVPSVTILEATASSQEDLVNMALTFDDDEIEKEPAVEEGNNNSELSNVNTNLNAGDPYGAVLWPASSAVAEQLLERYSELQGLTILELGAGTGLVSIVAAMAGASRVMATDYEPIPLTLLEYAAEHLNKFNNDKDGTPKELMSIVETFHFDMCDEDTPLPRADIVVAADIMYEPHTGKAMARRAFEALHQKSRVIIGDSPGRPGRPAFLKELKRLGVSGPTVQFYEKMGRTCSGERHDLICGKGSTSVTEIPQDLEVAIMELDPNVVCIDQK